MIPKQDSRSSVASVPLNWQHVHASCIQFLLSSTLEQSVSTCVVHDHERGQPLTKISNEETTALTHTISKVTAASHGFPVTATAIRLSC